jgi:hypothetical protein
MIRNELLMPAGIEVRELNARKNFHWSHGLPDLRASVLRGPV